jgi:hypothetical protein
MFLDDPAVELVLLLSRLPRRQREREGEVMVARIGVMCHLCILSFIEPMCDSSSQSVTNQKGILNTDPVKKEI